MNGVHDMGGMQDMGPVVREENEPVFHHEWERRLYAMTRVLNMGPKWNIHMSRYTMEQLPPAQYLGVSYYERWLLGFERRLAGSGVLSPEELEDRKPRPGGVNVPRVTPEQVKNSLRPWRAPEAEQGRPPRFKSGDTVRARNLNPRSHTRLPRYIRGHVGSVERDLGVMELPDSWVASQDHNFQHAYSVRFAARELWGPDAAPKDAVYIDLWDDYLDAA